MSKATNRTNLIKGVNQEQFVVLTSATKTVTPSESGTTFLLSKTDGITITMPDAGAGDIIGATYKFKILTTPSSVGYTINGATSDNILQGAALIVGSDVGTSDAFNPAASDHQIVISAATKGWLEGGMIELTCIEADQWFVHAVLGGTGTIATPFT